MKQIKNVITEAKIIHYIDVTTRALAKAKIKKTNDEKGLKIAKDFLNMANCYFNDAKHFRDNNDYVNAFAAINYAHAWLDAGARIGVFDYEGDSVLFAADGTE